MAASLSYKKTIYVLKVTKATINFKYFFQDIFTFFPFFSFQQGHFYSVNAIHIIQIHLKLQLRIIIMPPSEFQQL